MEFCRNVGLVGPIPHIKNKIVYIQSSMWKVWKTHFRVWKVWKTQFYTYTPSREKWGEMVLHSYNFKKWA